jgi:hypothetical protein
MNCWTLSVPVGDVVLARTLPVIAVSSSPGVVTGAAPNWEAVPPPPPARTTTGAGVVPPP